MPFGLWRKKRIFRRHSPTTADDGYAMSKSQDIVIPVDVQEDSQNTSTEEDGDYATQKLTVFSEMEIQTADERTGRKADLLWYQGKWFECRSAILSANTILKHWTSTFVQCADQYGPPDEEGLLK